MPYLGFFLKPAQKFWRSKNENFRCCNDARVISFSLGWSWILNCLLLRHGSLRNLERLNSISCQQPSYVEQTPLGGRAHALWSWGHGFVSLQAFSLPFHTIFIRWVSLIRSLNRCITLYKWCIGYRGATTGEIKMNERRCGGVAKVNKPLEGTEPWANQGKQ